MPVVAVSMTESDLQELERLKDSGGFSSRSEVVRHALQSLLAEHRSIENLKGDLTAIFTVLYSSKGKNTVCLDVQHEFNHLLTALMHAHSNDGTCVEVMLVKGPADDARSFLRQLRTQTQVLRVGVDLMGVK